MTRNPAHLRLARAAKEEGSYQDIEVGGHKIVKGWRECDSRWRLIKPHMHPRTTILDIGSHYGFFGIKAARLNESSLVLSVESSKARYDIQAEVVEMNELTNVVVLKKHLSLAYFMKLARTVEIVDTVLALSVLHYFKPDEIPEVLWCLSQIAQNVIIEFPDDNESEVANKNIVQVTKMERLLNLLFDSVTYLGKTKSPKDPSAYRKMYLAQSYSIKRHGLAGYFWARGGRKHELEYKKANWYLNGKQPQYHGVNLQTLLALEPVLPTTKNLFDEAGRAYYHLIQHEQGRVTDIHARNVLVTPKDMVVLDYQEGLGQPIYGNSWSAYKELVLTQSPEELANHLEKMHRVGRIAALFNDIGAKEEGEL